MEWERLTGSHTVSPVSEVSPYTHRDAVTHLEEIKSLTRWSHHEIERLESLLRSGDSDLQDQINKFKKNMADSLTNLEISLTELYLNSKNEVVAFDPTNGTRSEGISTVVSRVYDNLRVYGLFAREFDEMGWSVAEWERWMSNNSARHFDLGFTYPRFNDELKGK